MILLLWKLIHIIFYALRPNTLFECVTCIDKKHKIYYKIKRVLLQLYTFHYFSINTERKTK